MTARIIGLLMCLTVVASALPRQAFLSQRKAANAVSMPGGSWTDTNAPIALWEFQETSLTQVLDTSQYASGYGNAHHASNMPSVASGPTRFLAATNSEGRLQYAYTLDHVDDGWIVPDSDDFWLSSGFQDDDPFTIGMMLSLADWTSPTNTMYLISKRDSAGNTNGEWEVLFFASPTRQIRARIYDANTAQYLGKRTLTDALTPYNGDIIYLFWTYNAVRNNTGLKFWVASESGVVELSSSDWSSGSYNNMQNTDARVRIGRIYDGLAPSKGDFYEVGIWGKVLATNVMAELFNNRFERIRE